MWKNIYVFISSTFKDMHSERDYLIKNVFPELSAWCAERKLRLFDIDLRWGITEEDAEKNKRVIDICLKNINKCRPFFISFLGQRRGWCPDRASYSNEILDLYKELNDEIGKRSVTELEIMHAALSPFGEEKKIVNPLFFFRTPSYIGDIESKKVMDIYTNPDKQDDIALERFKETIRKSGYDCYDYTANFNKSATTPELMFEADGDELKKGRLTDFRIDGKPFKDIILHQMKRVIEAELGLQEVEAPQSELERELNIQESFLSKITESTFVPSTQAKTAIDEYIRTESKKCFIVTAKAGMGKSTFMAEQIARYQKEPSYKVLYRFLGISDNSMTSEAYLSSIFAEIDSKASQAFVDSDDETTFLQKLIKVFQKPAQVDYKRDLLVKLSEYGQDKTVLLFLDGINQLEGDLRENFDFLISLLPHNVKIILSVKSDSASWEYIKAQSDNHATVYDFYTFNTEEKKRLLIAEYLEQYLKTLDENQIAMILQKENSSNPLYVNVLLNELRVYGAFKGVGELIGKGFGDTLNEAFSKMLSRLEADPAYTPIPPDKVVPLLFTALGAARNGLSIGYITEVFLAKFGNQYTPQEIVEAVHLYLHQVKNYMSYADGKHLFLYESFKLAVLDKYQNDLQSTHMILSKIMQRHLKSDEQFAYSEFLYHLHNSKQCIREYLNNYNFVSKKIEIAGISSMIADFDLYQEYEPIKQTLINDSDFLTKNPASLCSQLLMRLGDSKDKNIELLLESAKQNNVLKTIKATNERVGLDNRLIDLPGIGVWTITAIVNYRIYLFNILQNTLLVMDASSYTVIDKITPSFQAMKSELRNNYIILTGDRCACAYDFKAEKLHNAIDFQTISEEFLGAVNIFIDWKTYDEQIYAYKSRIVKSKRHGIWLLSDIDVGNETLVFNLTSEAAYAALSCNIDGSNPRQIYSTMDKAFPYLGRPYASNGNIMLTVGDHGGFSIISVASGEVLHTFDDELPYETYGFVGDLLLVGKHIFDGNGKLLLTDEKQLETIIFQEKDCSSPFVYPSTALTPYQSNDKHFVLSSKFAHNEYDKPQTSIADENGKPFVSRLCSIVVSDNHIVFNRIAKNESRDDDSASFSDVFDTDGKSLRRIYGPPTGFIDPFNLRVVNISDGKLEVWFDYEQPDIPFSSKKAKQAFSCGRAKDEDLEKYGCEFSIDNTSVLQLTNSEIDDELCWILRSTDCSTGVTAEQVFKKKRVMAGLAPPFMLTSTLKRKRGSFTISTDVNQLVKNNGKYTLNKKISQANTFKTYGRDILTESEPAIPFAVADGKFYSGKHKYSQQSIKALKTTTWRGGKISLMLYKLFHIVGIHKGFKHLKTRCILVSERDIESGEERMIEAIDCPCWGETKYIFNKGKFFILDDKCQVYEFEGNANLFRAKRRVILTEKMRAAYETVQANKKLFKQFKEMFPNPDEGSLYEYAYDGKVWSCDLASKKSVLLDFDDKTKDIETQMQNSYSLKTEPFYTDAPKYKEFAFTGGEFWNLKNGEVLSRISLEEDIFTLSKKIKDLGESSTLIACLGDNLDKYLFVDKRYAIDDEFFAVLTYNELSIFKWKSGEKYAAIKLINPNAFQNVMLIHDKTTNKRYVFLSHDLIFCIDG